MCWLGSSSCFGCETDTAGEQKIRPPISSLLQVMEAPKLGLRRKIVLFLL